MQVLDRGKIHESLTKFGISTARSEVLADFLAGEDLIADGKAKQKPKIVTKDISEVVTKDNDKGMEVMDNDL